MQINGSWCDRTAGNNCMNHLQVQEFVARFSLVFAAAGGYNPAPSPDTRRGANDCRQ